MNKLYNTQNKIASNIFKFLNSVGNFRKTQLNIIPFIVIGMILSESVVSSDIAKKLKDNFSFVHHDSVVKRIYRFFNNKLFNPYLFYDLIIKHVISNFSVKHSDNKIFISFDHMFCKNHFTILMFTLRIGKQSIPLWFRCFKGKHEPDAFKNDLFIEGVSYCINLFKHLNHPKIIFLADRFFNSSSLLKFIHDHNCFYCVRVKTLYNVSVYDKKEKHFIWKNISSLSHCVYKSTFYSVFFTRNMLKTNLVISKSHNISDPWYILTNLDPREAIKTYGKRFGSIEFFFKSQKSNGFYLESTSISNLHAFESMYSLCCFASLFINIIGISYCKNQYNSQYKHCKITNIKNRTNNTKDRIRSYFEIGLILFNKAYSSSVYIYIPFTFKLYDI